jgi:hypothetical protein
MRYETQVVVTRKPCAQQNSVVNVSKLFLFSQKRNLDLIFAGQMQFPFDFFHKLLRRSAQLNC